MTDDSRRSAGEEAIWPVIWETIKATWPSRGIEGEVAEGVWRGHLGLFDPNALIDAIKVEAEATDRLTVRGLVAAYWVEKKGQRLRALALAEGTPAATPDWQERYEALSPEEREPLEAQISVLYPSAYYARAEPSWKTVWAILVVSAHQDPEGTRRRLDAAGVGA